MNESNKIPFARRSFAPREELSKYARFQRRPFNPLEDVKCFSCHKTMHIIMYYKRKQTKDYQQKVQKTKKLPQANNQRRFPTR